MDLMSLSGADIVAIMDQLATGFAEGYLEPPNVQVWPFDQAVEAYQAAEKGGASVKHVLQMP